MLQLRVILLWITGILFLLCRSVMASPDDNRGPKELLIGISFSIPPYVIQEKDNGLELEVLRQAFEVKGYTVLPSYLPLARTFMSFEDGSLDGVINVKEGMVNGHYSDIVITFQNYAISLSEKNLKIDSLQDLGGKSVAAFQRAAFILGADFANVVLSNSDYLEVADQSLQVKQLFRDRVEVIVMEEKIFKYFRKWLFNRSVALKGNYIVNERNLRRKVRYHNIFPPSEYRFAFLSAQVRDDFNEGLRTIIRNGRYEAILERYSQDMALPPT